MASLILHPEHADDLPRADLVRIAAALALGGADPEPGCVPVGAGFVEHFTLVGCAPALVDAAGEPLCLRLVRESHATLLAGTNAVAPRCRNCRHRFGDWREHLERWRADPLGEWPCPGCGTALNAARLDWRHHAGAIRAALEFVPVFPGEVQPQSTLFARLRELSGRDWDYFFHAP
ncbi:MAG: hypothetical protein KDG50_01820 [Chromatiales bacterium]|nr:hypothetical protein [Chromatiales bacterium]